MVGALSPAPTLSLCLHPPPSHLFVVGACLFMFYFYFLYTLLSVSHVGHSRGKFGSLSLEKPAVTVMLPVIIPRVGGITTGFSQGNVFCCRGIFNVHMPVGCAASSFHLTEGLTHAQSQIMCEQRTKIKALISKAAAIQLKHALLCTLYTQHL